MTNPQAIVVAAVVLAGAMIVSNLQAAPTATGESMGHFQAIGLPHAFANYILDTRSGIVSLCEFDGDNSTCHRIGRAHSE